MEHENGNSKPESQEASVQQGRDAIGEAVETRADVPNAMRRGDIGDITFAWGKPGDPDKDYRGGYGISHILEKHGRDVLDAMPKVIASGAIARKYGPREVERIDLELENYRAVLSRYAHDNTTAWLLTGWDTNVPR